MSKLDEAYKYEKSGDAVSALAAYEKAFDSNEGMLEDYINASVLLFVCQDYGYISQHNLSNKFVNEAWQKSINLLDMAEKKFGKRKELNFWRKYFEFIILGEKEFIDESKLYIDGGLAIACIHLLPNLNSGDPYFEKCLKLSKTLYEQVEGEKTEKEKYVKSILDKYI